MSRACLLFLSIALAACQMPGAETASPARLSPLDTMTRMEIPASADTVGKAADYLLRPVGYRVVEGCGTCPPEAAEIAAKPVSPLALRPQFTTIGRALVLVGGSRTRVVVDPEAGRVAYGWFGTVPGTAP